MGIIEHLQQRLQRLAERMEAIDEKRRGLDDERAEVAELYRATEIVLKAELRAKGLASAEETSWAAIKSKLRTMTLRDAIYTIVRAQGEEGIHVDDILQNLKDAGFPLKSKTPKSSVVSTIYHDIKNHGTYERVARNTFKVAKGREAAMQAELVRVQND